MLWEDREMPEPLVWILGISFVIFLLVIAAAIARETFW